MAKMDPAQRSFPGTQRKPTVLIADSDREFARDMATVLDSRYEVTIHPESPSPSTQKPPEVPSKQVPPPAREFDVAIMSVDLLEPLLRILPTESPDETEELILGLRTGARIRKVLVLGGEAPKVWPGSDQIPTIARYTTRYPRPNQLLEMLADMTAPSADEAARDRGCRSQPYER